MRIRGVVEDLPPGVERVRPWEDPRLMIGWEDGRADSPYTVEGRIARAGHAAGSLVSKDPVFRSRARRRVAILYVLMLLPSLAGIILILKAKLG